MIGALLVPVYLLLMGIGTILIASGIALDSSRARKTGVALALTTTAMVTIIIALLLFLAHINQLSTGTPA